MQILFAHLFTTMLCLMEAVSMSRSIPMVMENIMIHTRCMSTRSPPTNFIRNFVLATLSVCLYERWTRLRMTG